MQVLDPDGNGSINFVQFSEGVKRILELQGCHFLISYTFSYRFSAIDLGYRCLLILGCHQQTCC